MTIPSQLTAALADRYRLERELTTANLQHPHILPLFDSGEAGGLLFHVITGFHERLRRLAPVN